MENKKRKILIVDDDSFLLDMYALKFVKNSFEVHTASGGMEALEKIRKGLVPDVIMMDIIMPGMNGFEMVEKLNEEKLVPDSVKIVLSNKKEQADVDLGVKLGISGYIMKANSTPQEVIEQVMEILKTKLRVTN